jgi:TPR repeat protein
MMRWLAGLAIAASVLQATAFAASHDVNPSAAGKAVQEGNWTQAIADWHDLYIKGEREAPAQLCGLYFDARQGKFDAARVIDWCRRAAANGDAWARYRMGLLYLTGTGVDRDPGQAQLLCASAAGAGQPDVPAGFCLAAVTIENERAARDALQPPRPPPRAAGSPAPTVQPEQACRQAFVATIFDAAAAASACRKAAAGGDGEALYRLGLMQLVGLGGPRDLDAAERDCAHAQAKSNGRVSTAFCAVAAALLRRAAAGLALSRQTGAIDVHPATGLALPKTEGDPYVGDRLLDEPRMTPTGLAYTCRQMSSWAIYEAPGFTVLKPRDTLFGRPIIAYRPADFAALDNAAASCANALAGVDPRGSLAPNFAAFRRSLDTLKARQVTLLKEQQVSRQDAALIEQLDRDYRTGRYMGSPNLTTQEGACIERVRQAWRASGRENRRRSLEIRDTSLATEGGRYVVRGTANTVSLDTAQREVIAGSAFSCTFEPGASERVATFSLEPGFYAKK